MLRAPSAAAGGRDTRSMCRRAVTTYPPLGMALPGSWRARCDACSMPPALPKARHRRAVRVQLHACIPTPRSAFTQHVGLSPRVLEWLPMGGACGVIALRRAARAVQAGDAEIVACIAGDTANETSFRDLLATFSSFSRDAVYPYGAGGPNASFALIADAYMRATGATREDFGKLAVAQRANARRNPLALLRGELTLAAIPRRAADRRAAAPVRLRHALRRRRRLPGDAGGARACTATAVRARAGRDRAPQRLSRRSGAVARRLGDGSRCAVGSRQASVQTMCRLWKPTTIIRSFRCCNSKAWACARRARRPRFVRRHDFTIEGSLPHNTGGGQLSMGQAGAAGGYLGLVEAMRQLLGQAGGRQVRERAPCAGRAASA